MLHARQYKCGPDKRHYRSSESVERLRKIQLPLRILRRPHIRGIRIGHRLQKSRAARRYKKRDQEQGIIPGIRCRKGQQRPRRKKKKPAQNSLLISKPMKKKTRRKLKNKIAKIYRKVNKGRLRIAQLTDLFQLRDQCPVDIVQKGPQKKQRAD